MQVNGVVVAVFAAPEAVVASAADVYGAHCPTEVAGDVEAVVAVWCFAWDTVIGGVGVCQCQRCVGLSVLLEEPLWLDHGWSAFDVLITFIVGEPERVVGREPWTEIVQPSLRFCWRE